MVGTERFELEGENFQPNSAQNTSANPESENSQLRAHEIHRPEKADSPSHQRTEVDKLSQAVETTEIPDDLREVMKRWLDLSPAIKEAVLSIVQHAPLHFEAKNRRTAGRKNELNRSIGTII